MHGWIYLVATERPLINIDATLLINLGLWLALFVFLRAVFWKPMIALITAREDNIEGARAAARGLETKAKKIRDDFDAALRKTRATAAEEREKLRAEGRRREGEILQSARDEVATVLEKRRAEIATQRDRLRTEVLATVPALAADIATRVLGREVRP